jgi:hypothetical protein
MEVPPPGPGYHAAIKEWVKSSKGKQKLKQERVGAPFERVAIDLIGPLPLSRRGKKYLVVMQDCFTQWVEVDAVATKKTTVVVRAFVNTCVSRYGPYGCPRVFTGDVFVEVCSILGIDRTTTTPYFSWSNSQVERVNQMLQSMLNCT